MNYLRALLIIISLFTFGQQHTSAYYVTCPGSLDGVLTWTTASPASCGSFEALPSTGPCSFSPGATGNGSKTITPHETSCMTSLGTAAVLRCWSGAGNSGTILSTSIDELEYKATWVWDSANTRCIPPVTGVISSSAATCSMPVNTGSCNVDLSWTTNGTPTVTSQVNRNNPAGTVFTANNSPASPAQTTSVSGAYANVNYELNNNGTSLDNVTITPSCAASLYWDTTTSTCKPCSNGGCNPSATPINGANTVGTLTCINGAADVPTCTPATCPLPWGGTLANGASVSAYSATNVAWNQSCAAGGVQETRTCTNGTLSGTFTNSSCTVDTPLPCNVAPWGAIAHGNSVTAYTSATVPFGNSCTSETRTCTNNVLSGSLTYSSCSVTGPMTGTLNASSASCTIPINTNSCSVNLSWTTTNPVSTSAVTQTNPATTTASGNNGGPKSALVAYPSSNFYLYNNAVELATTAVTASCTAGSYWNGSNCVSSSCTLPWGGSIASGNSVTAYNTSYVASPATCSSGVVSETRTCTNSVLSGTYSNGTCVEGSASFTSTPACNISVGSAGCNSTLGWTSANAGTVTLTDCGGGVYASYGTGARTGSVYVPYNAGCYQIRDGSSNILATANPVTSACTAGAAWNGSICVAVPTISLTASPASLLTGAASTLTWTVSGDATSCSIDNGIGAVSVAGGSIGTGAIAATKTYALSCSNVAGTATAPATVTVTPSPELSADLITPATAVKGIASTFSTTITNNGDASTGAAFNNFIQLASGPGGTGTVIDLASVSMGTLAPASSDITAQSYTFTATGTYSMRACADKTNSGSVGTITESNEGNNCGLWQDIAVAWPPITGTLSANPTSCIITNGANTCTTDFTWNTVNPIGPSQVIGDGGGPFSSLMTAFTQTLAARFGNHIFRLYNNAQELASTTIAATCTGTTAWESGSGICMTCQNGGCTNNLCNNNANNPPFCSTGPFMMTGWLATAPTSCTVPTGSSACNNDINLTWGVTNPVSYTAITNSMGPTELYTGNTNPNGGQWTSVPFRYDGAGGSLPVTYFLYNNTVALDSKVINVSCFAGPNKWDTTPAVSGGQICADPSTNMPIIHGENGYGAPSIDYSCNLSNSYEILKDGAPFHSDTIVPDGSTAIMNYPLTQTGNYKVICKHGSVVSAGETRPLNSLTPPPSIISINALPKTITAGSQTVLTWAVQYPPLAPTTCTLSAKAICTNNVCTAAQTAAETALNTIINSATTDTNDPSGVRSITSAVTTIVDPINYKALGKKTFSIAGTTDFTINCGGVKATARIRVTNTNEQ